jgi:hypothetical protein
MAVKVLRKKRLAAIPRKDGMFASLANKRLTIRDLGWTRERAREVRAKLATFAVDWDEPSMDIYTEP